MSMCDGCSYYSKHFGEAAQRYAVASHKFVSTDRHIHQFSPHSNAFWDITITAPSGVTPTVRLAIDYCEAPFAPSCLDLIADDGVTKTWRFDEFKDQSNALISSPLNNIRLITLESAAEYSRSTLNTTLQATMSDTESVTEGKRTQHMIAHWFGSKRTVKLTHTMDHRCMDARFVSIEYGTYGISFLTKFHPV